MSEKCTFSLLGTDQYGNLQAEVEDLPIYTSFMATGVSNFNRRIDVCLPALDLLFGAFGAARLA